MAQHFRIELTDDIDGSEATETVAFSLDGVSYEIDLNGVNASGLREKIAPFAAAARKSPRGGARTAVRRPQRSGSRSATIRQWAQENGYEVSARGRIHREVEAAYDKAQAAALS